MRTPIIIALGIIFIGMTLIFSPALFIKIFPPQKVIEIVKIKKVTEFVDRYKDFEMKDLILKKINDTRYQLISKEKGAVWNISSIQDDSGIGLQIDKKG